MSAGITGYTDNNPQTDERSGVHCHLQSIDGIQFQLKRAFDFGFISDYGRVFRVYDGQSSGNICFGTEMGARRYFVKFAGAPTLRYEGDPALAVSRLKSAPPIYRDLRHRNLIELVDAREVGGGFVLAFKWVEGDCLGRECPQAHSTFMQLPVDDRLRAFGDILSFFEHVAAMDYVAIDFYDSSIMYDFESGTATICDIDLFRRQPCINDMGRMWGSSRFQSPEEYQLGARIDEVTNVYTLGAVAFALFGRYSRAQAHWQLGGSSFCVVQRATSAARADRQQSIRQFAQEWSICTKS